MGVAGSSHHTEEGWAPRPRGEGRVPPEEVVAAQEECDPERACDVTQGRNVTLGHTDGVCARLPPCGGTGAHHGAQHPVQETWAACHLRPSSCHTPEGWVPEATWKRLCVLEEVKSLSRVRLLATLRGALRRKREAVELPSAKPRGPEER